MLPKGNPPGLWPSPRYQSYFSGNPFTPLRMCRRFRALSLLIKIWTLDACSPCSAVPVKFGAKGDCCGHF
jgi:hypothetical protein